MTDKTLFVLLKTMFIYTVYMNVMRIDTDTKDPVSHNCFYYTSKPECAIPDDNKKDPIICYVTALKNIWGLNNIAHRVKGEDLSLDGDVIQLQRIVSEWCIYVYEYISIALYVYVIVYMHTQIWTYILYRGCSLLLVGFCPFFANIVTFTTFVKRR